MHFQKLNSVDALWNHTDSWSPGITLKPFIVLMNEIEWVETPEVLCSSNRTVPRTWQVSQMFAKSASSVIAYFHI